jgi:hypothetical protein
VARIHDPIDDAAAIEATPILLAFFADGAEFLRALDDDELTLLTRARPPLRADVVVEITWPGLPNRCFVRARVTRLRGDRLTLRLHADDRRVHDFLVAVAHGARIARHPRAADRYSVRLAVSWRAFGTL